MEAILVAVTLATAPKLAAAERAFVAFRDADDVERLDPTAAHQASRDRAAGKVGDALKTVDIETLSPIDRRAYDAMHDAIDPAAHLPQDDATRALYAAYRDASYAADRLAVLADLSREPSEERRRARFLSLAPVWEAVDGKPGSASPYRALVAARRRSWAGKETPFEGKAKEWGIAPDALEAVYVGILESWRDHLAPDAPIEPWNWYYANGAAGRAVAGQLSLDTTIATALRYSRALGADPSKLKVRLDLTPRAGKDPVAFTDFVRHGRDEGTRWKGGRFLISTSYTVGGLGNLYELMHELGHAVHIAAIRARPAFNDWPDSDVLTEALADMLGLEAYETAFARNELGATVDAADLRRDALSGVILDVAWALFELRVHRDPASDPNAIWTEITRDYLRLLPHPELSWWAMRGQLIDSPGYMTNYALGAVLSAALRDRVRVLRGADAFEAPTPALYAFLADKLYRFGLARPSRQVVEEFLGAPLDPRSLERTIAGAGAP